MYLDPSFGGMLIQVIIAIVAAGGAIVFAMRKKIGDFFKKDKKDDDAGMRDVSTYVSNDDVVDALADE